MHFLILSLLLVGCNQITQDDCINYLVDCCYDDEACQESCMPTYETCMSIVERGQ